MTGLKKIKTAVLISGRGSNLYNLIKFSKKKKSPILIDLVVSNKKNAIGLKYAKKYKIKKKIINYKNKKTAEKDLLLALKKRKIKFVCLAGFMKILSSNFIKNFGYKIINIHPSLLPKFKGTNTHKRVLKSNEIYSGCTVHFVTPKIDNGKIIFKKRVLIDKNETENSLKNKILKLEHKLYSHSIISILK